MNERSIRVLELDKVKDCLAGLVTSPLGGDLAAALFPSGDRTQIERWLQETTEAKEVLRRGDLSLHGIADMRITVRRCLLGAVASPQELYHLAQVLGVARRTHRFFLERQGDFPLLAEHAGAIVLQKPLEDQILTCVNESGEILDRASEKLRRLRSDIRSAQAEIRAKLEGMLRSSVMQKYLQESLVTMRGDRYVLPIKVEHRGQVPGIVHDQSASGATVYIEPMAVVVISNRLRQLSAEEEHEVERLLRELSAAVGAQADAVQNNQRILGLIDFALAKGRLSSEWHCVGPELSLRQELDFLQARHPLIPREEVRPIDVRLGQDFSVMLITGPNTGGKTVTLKTIGLLSLMVQCGLHIPVAYGSRAAVFGTIFADIGDEQSIEQSLSTFSSHMSNIRLIVDQADSSSLVLLDELGAGTDPTEGAALAMAIVDEFFDRGARVVATTHYSELKAYAHTKTGVQNASMEFDVDSLRPTFKLTIGLPGKSNAFEISERLGLDLNVILRARGYLSGEVLRVEDLIRSLEKNRRETEEARTEAYSKRSQALSLEKQVQEKAERLKAREQEIIRRAESDAKVIINRAKHEMDALMVQLRQAQEAKTAQEMSNAMENVRHGWRDLAKDLEKDLDRAPAQPSDEVGQDVSVGEEVMVTHLKQKGRVVEVKSPSQATVQIGSIRASVDVRLLRKIEQKKQADVRPAAGFNMVDLNRSAVKIELDIRGHTVEEGVTRTDKYIDDALVSGLTQVHIIHGKGTGVLREGIRDFLNAHPRVSSYRYGNANEGGSGVTVVVLH